MFGLDDRIAELGAEGGLVLALAVALLLGLRHATDPDHLAAVSTLVLADDERGTRQAGRLGLAWGAGHAVTVVVLGLPVVLYDDVLPDWAQRLAEGLIGLVIVALAVRVLVRWRRGRPPEHPYADRVGRSPRASFGIGLLHGAGGSAGVTILLVAAIDANAEAVVALLLFAAGSAVSMALASGLWGRVLTVGAVERRLAALAPALGAASLAFGLWYGAGALAG